MEKIKELIKPDEFALLKVSKSTLEYIKFDGDLDDRNKIESIVVKLHNKMIKLKEFNHLFMIKAFETKQEFPNQHIWDSFFREAKDMDERKPGERPDTLHISNLPIRWFLLNHSDDDPKPSEKILKRIFEKFGRIRNVDIPICDPYRKQMKSYMSGLLTFSFDEKDFFEAYIQFKDYQGFVKAMDSLRGMKLLHKDEDAFENYAVSIKVDFDKTKHMTEAAIKRREIVRERLIKRQKQKEDKEKYESRLKMKDAEEERKKERSLKEEKEKRRRQREEKRKAKILEQLKNSEADEINAKIAKEEKKLLKAQRKLEAIRLVEELFRRIKVKHEDELTPFEKNKNSVTELSKYKLSSEKEHQEQRNKLHKIIESRVVLKTVLNKSIKDTPHLSDSDTSLSPDESPPKKRITTIENPPEQPYHFLPYIPPIYPDVRTLQYYSYLPRRPQRGGQGPSRSYRNFRQRGRNRNLFYPPEVQDQYQRYFNKFLRRSSKSRSYSRSRSRSRSRKRSRRSYSRSRRSYTPRRSYSKEGRSRSTERTKSRSVSRERRRRRSNSRRSTSVDSSKFVSPKSLKIMKEKMSEWSRTPSPRK
ncbi:A-kinase anchor protein 17A isoform X2 [Onthophagus taurus]|nr:A-kinase anchor protein 17A isoform X2 [Onthophagus taurus]XP_022920363.1 A-kinase anchor protein 17A isoform X2 [Onthophagus taurus]